LVKFVPESLEILHQRIVACEKCRRLRNHCTTVAKIRRRAFLDQEYWGKPIPGFGDIAARLWIIGLAPAAHGANRTGRVFTGDRSGDFLFAALHRTGYANQPTSEHREDGLKLTDCFISAAARCAPPANKPTPNELARCAPFLKAEWALLKKKRCILALGSIAWNASWELIRRQTGDAPSPRTSFGHGATAEFSEDLTLVGCYHPSQQNTFTGRLTPKMLDDILRKCQRITQRAPHHANPAILR
jgi:uracil-DNA glycosylase family 4